MSVQTTIARVHTIEFAIGEKGNTFLIKDGFKGAFAIAGDIYGGGLRSSFPANGEAKAPIFDAERPTVRNRLERG